MLKSLKLSRLTVFSDATLRFGKNLNVIIGENGTGKSHLLKIAYASIAVSAKEGIKLHPAAPTKALLQTALADKLVGVFRPEALGRLASRKQGRERCDVELSFRDSTLDLSYAFATNSKSEVSVDRLPTAWVDKMPVFFPTRELLTLYPGFVSLYEGHYLEFEETWRDLCLLLGAPLQRGPKESRIQELFSPLEAAMGGKIELDKNGRFYLVTPSGRMEMPLVAEGVRKLGMLSRLIATGSLIDKGYLFWDEPEANLNPKLVKDVAKTILAICLSGIQTFIATHSLFLLREIEIQLHSNANRQLGVRYFGLSREDGELTVEQSQRLDDISVISALDEELEQSDRYLALGN